MMRSLLVFSIFGLLLAPIIIENSFAQSVTANQPTTQVFFQIKLYDKNGNFYGYIQPHMQIFNLDALVKFYAPYTTNSSVTYNGHNYMLMKYQEPSGFDHFEQLGGYFVNAPVNGVQTEVFYGWHDSYLANAGDKETVFWEFLIPSK